MNLKLFLDTENTMVQQGRVDYVLEVTLDINSYKIRRPDSTREIYVFADDIHLSRHKVILFKLQCT